VREGADNNKVKHKGIGNNMAKRKGKDEPLTE
jgi:hypothetical protein